MTKRRRKKIEIPQAMACPECIRDCLDVVALIATISAHDQAVTNFCNAARAGRATGGDLNNVIYSWGVVKEIVAIACREAEGFCEYTAVTGTVN
mgnify:CR=1 FL=1